MNKNTSGALVVLIVALAGIQADNMAAWLLAVITAALAFLTEELREFAGYNIRVASIATILAVISWLTIMLAVLSFAI